MQNVFFSQKITRASASFLLAATIAVLAGCSDNTASLGITTTTTATTSTAATLQLSASPATVNSDGLSQTTITVTAVNAANAVVPDTTVTMSANTGNLGSGTVITGSNGQATLTFTSGTLSKSNRIATITATSGSISAIPLSVPIVGSTVTVNPTIATLPDDGTSPVTLTVTAKDAGGNLVPDTAVTLTTGGTGTVTLTPQCTTLLPCFTDASGQLAVVATGSAPGNVTVTAAAVGDTELATLTVSPSAATFGIDQQTLNGTVIANNILTPMYIGDTLVVRVNAPAPTTSVLFATSIGLWNGTSSYLLVPVAAGKATATLTTAGAGAANIQVYDLASVTSSDALTVTMTAKTANSITIQASPGLLSKSTTTTTGVSTLTASVKDINGFPVGGAPVAFSILNPTGGGETVSPVVVFSATATGNGIALGDARTTFTAGSLSSPATGVQVRASVVPDPLVIPPLPLVATEAMGVNVTDSGNDASIVIGGTAGSVTFGQATVLAEGPNATTYILAMSVQVADSNGNPVPQGTAVNLSVWPIAWSTSSVPCTIDPDTATSGTFLNEDIDENVNLETPEDGVRINSLGAQAGGTADSLITPPNSAGGTLPGTVYTDASGVATFDLTYTKTNAIWIVDRIRARTTVQGTETVGETTFRLEPLQKDSSPTCHLPPSPYYF